MRVIRAVLAALGLLTGMVAAVQQTPATTHEAVAVAPYKVVFIGDSYTSLDYVPAGAPLPWSSRLCSELGWSCVNLAHGGTGYLQNYDGQGSFTAQIPAAVAAAPNAVFILGGRNELGQENTSTWQNGVAAFYSNLRAGLPSATIYGLSPLWDDDPTPAGIGVMRTVVQAATQAVGGQYLNLGDLFFNKPDLIVPPPVDGIHPNDAGMDWLKNAVMGFLPLAPRTRPAPDPSTPPSPYPYPRPTSRPR